MITVTRYQEPRQKASGMLFSAQFNCLCALTFLINLEKARQAKDVTSGHKERRVSCYNLKEDFLGLQNTPVFSTISVEAVELFLKADFEDLELINESRENMPLLHFCVIRGLVSEYIVKTLSHQVNIKWRRFRAHQLGKWWKPLQRYSTQVPCSINILFSALWSGQQEAFMLLQVVHFKSLLTRCLLADWARKFQS